MVAESVHHGFFFFLFLKKYDICLSVYNLCKVSVAAFKPSWVMPRSRSACIIIIIIIKKNNLQVQPSRLWLFNVRGESQTAHKPAIIQFGCYNTVTIVVKNRRWMCETGKFLLESTQINPMLRVKDKAHGVIVPNICSGLFAQHPCIRFS